MLATIVPYYMYIPHYYYIPVSDNAKHTDLTWTQVVGLIVLLALLVAWITAIYCVIDDLIWDDNKQDKIKHTIELIVWIVIGAIWLIAC